MSNDPSTKPSDIIGAFNYVKRDTAASTVIDGSPNDSATYTCGGTGNCIRLHNGAILRFYDPFTFGGTSNLHAIWFLVDPDGINDSTFKSVWLVLYYDGHITSWGNTYPGTIGSSGPYPAANPANDPSWFSWD